MSAAIPFLNQAVTKLQANDIPVAIELLRKAVDADRFHAHAWFLLGMALSHTDAQDEAIKCVDRAMMFDPDDARYKFESAKLYRNNLMRKEALALFEQAAKAAPNQGGVILEFLKELAEASSFDRIIELSRTTTLLGDYDVPIRAMGFGALADSFRSQEVAQWLRSSTPSDNGELQLWQAVKYQHMIYSSDYSPEDVIAFLREAAKRKKHTPQGIPIKKPDPNRKLRIGFVSPDFRRHSVSFFLRSVFANWDKAQSDLILISTFRADADPIQQEFSQVASEWHRCEEDEIPDFINRIRGLDIDIGVDLSGLTDNHRLDAFSERIAPIQVTYLGSPWSTGVPAMDYRIVDPFTDPDGAERFSTEKLVRIESPFLCYRPLDYPITPSRQPQENSAVVFACFSIINKVSIQCLDNWTSVLKAIPNSKLALKNKSFRDQATADRVREAFEAQGVAEQIEIWPFSASHEAHFEDYNRVDIMLDTFPYAGTTTTCEALWMGVPVISLIGQQHASRVGLSVLTTVGLGDCATDSVEQFVSKAVELAQDSDRRQNLRANLRADMLASPLCNGALMAQKLQEAFREMWKAKCEEVTANG